MSLRFSSIILGTYQSVGLIFWCHVFLHFHTVHQVLKARILKLFLIPFSAGKEFTCDTGDLSLIFGLGRSPGGEIGYPLQYSWSSLVTQTVKNLSAVQETWVPSLGWEDLLKKKMATHSCILAWKVPWTEEPGRLVHGVTKGWTRLRNFHFLSPVDHLLSELSTVPRPSWVALHGMAYSFTELHKAVIRVLILANFLQLLFLFWRLWDCSSSVCLLMGGTGCGENILLMIIQCLMI